MARKGSTSSTALARRGGSIVKGSITQVAKATGKSIPEIFQTVELIAFVDTSGSMDAPDSRGGKTRYQVACEDLRTVQEQHPGKVAVFSFSSYTKFCPSGVPVNQREGTLIATALNAGKPADIPGGMKFVLISDGEPLDEQEALAVAKTYNNPISTIYVGPETDHGGRDFLARLAKASGGASIQAYRVINMLPVVQRMLEAK